MYLDRLIHIVLLFKRRASHSSVNDSAEFFSKLASLHSGVNYSAVTKVGVYKVDFLGEY
jgi:hypothetical protein